MTGRRMTTIDIHKLSINVPLRFYKQLKIHCTMQEVTMTMFVRQAIREKIERDKEEAT